MAKPRCGAVPWGSPSEPLVVAGPELAPIPAAVGVAASLLSCPDPPVFIPLLLSQTQSPLCHRCRTHTPVALGVVRESYAEDGARAEAALLFDKQLSLGRRAGELWD